MNCLELTLYPSLVLALLDGRYVKKFGVKKGVYAGDDLYMSGRWYNAWQYVGDVEREAVDYIYPLLEKYGDCVGISTSPGDEDLLFVVAFLTQNTNYHTNVLRWAEALFSRGERLEDVARQAPEVGRSYQLQRLPPAVAQYLKLGRPRRRQTLLSIPGVGPKVADLFLLFTGDTAAAPVDKHFMRQAPRLGLRGGPPKSAYCKKYDCGTCPAAGSCLRRQAEEKYGRLAGWVQTLSYLIDKGKLQAP
ncbi:MAG: DNA lyase [Pyrobaculum sp.]